MGYEIGDRFLNVRTSGIAVITDIREEHGTYFDDIGYTLTKYILYGKRTGRTLSVDEGMLNAYVNLQILIPIRTKILEPYRYIKRLSF